MPAIAQAATSPNHGIARERENVSITIAVGTRNGSSETGSGIGSPNGPSHHVGRPMSRLAFHTDMRPMKTASHVRRTIHCHPGVSSPAVGSS